MYFLARFNRNRNGTHIEQLFQILFHTNIKCMRRIFRFIAQQYKPAIHFSKDKRKYFDCSVIVCSPIKINLMLMI